jgi:hypothetical protein
MTSGAFDSATEHIMKMFVNRAFPVDDHYCALITDAGALAPPQNKTSVTMDDFTEPPGIVRFKVTPQNEGAVVSVGDRWYYAYPDVEFSPTS